MTLGTHFTGFTESLKKIKRMLSIDSKHGELIEFYKLLSDFKNDKRITTETKNRKNRILNSVNQLYNKYFDTYKKLRYRKFKQRDEKFFDPNQFKILGKKSEWTEEKTERNAETSTV